MAVGVSPDAPPAPAWKCSIHKNIVCEYDGQVLNGASFKVTTSAAVGVSMNLAKSFSSSRRHGMQDVIYPRMCHRIPAQLTVVQTEPECEVVIQTLEHSLEAVGAADKHSSSILVSCICNNFGNVAYHSCRLSRVVGWGFVQSNVTPGGRTSRCSRRARTQTKRVKRSISYAS